MTLRDQQKGDKAKGRRMAQRDTYRMLFEPFTLGHLSLRNRIVMPAVSLALASDDGHVTPHMVDYFASRARGGVGLIIAGMAAVDHSRGRTGPNKMVIDDDKYIPGLRQLVEAIHEAGAKAAVQLYHGGGYAPSSLIGKQPVAPSPVPCRDGGDLPHPLTVVEIEEIVQRFARAAELSVKAGFDGLELHGSGRYLIAQFLSPSKNQRQDRYGGDTTNRARFLLEIVGAIRKAVGQSYPLLVKITGAEYGIENGVSLEDATGLATTLQEAGVDAIHVTAHFAKHPFVESAEPEGSQVDLAAAVKKAVRIPVIAAGRITPVVGEKALRDGKADLIAIGRALVADPDLPARAAVGSERDTRPCITCLYCDWLTPQGKVGCTVNPSLGREEEFVIKPADRVKTVLVIGGGPAGMEAARVAALRGHKVTLCERRNELGGQLRLATVPLHKDNLKALAPYMADQLVKAGVTVELGTGIDASAVDRWKPEVVVLAAGGVPIVPDIPGVGGHRVVTAEDVLSDRVRVGERVVIIGGGLVGCETAELLAARGRRVTIVEALPKIAVKLFPRIRGPLLERLQASRVAMLVSTSCTRVTENALEVVDGNGQRMTIAFDTLVLAAGSKPDQSLLQTLKRKVAEVHLAGDCIEPRDLMAAIGDGARVGHAI